MPALCILRARTVAKIRQHALGKEMDFSTLIIDALECPTLIYYKVAEITEVPVVRRPSLKRSLPS
jgi:hypothetical protein